MVQVFLLSPLVPKEVKESDIISFSSDVLELSLINTSILTLRSFVNIFNEAIVEKYSKALKDIAEVYE